MLSKMPHVGGQQRLKSQFIEQFCSLFPFLVLSNPKPATKTTKKTAKAPAKATKTTKAGKTAGKDAASKKK